MFSQTKMHCSDMFLEISFYTELLGAYFALELGNSKVQVVSVPLEGPLFCEHLPTNLTLVVPQT